MCGVEQVGVRVAKFATGLCKLVAEFRIRVTLEGVGHGFPPVVGVLVGTVGAYLADRCESVSEAEQHEPGAQFACVEFCTGFVGVASRRVLFSHQK